MARVTGLVDPSAKSTSEPISTKSPNSSRVFNLLAAVKVDKLSPRTAGTVGYCRWLQSVTLGITRVRSNHYCLTAKSSVLLLAWWLTGIASRGNTSPHAELNVHVINRILVHVVLEDTTEDRCPEPEDKRLSKESLATAQAHRSRLAHYARVMLRDDAPDVVMAIFRCTWSLSPNRASELGWTEALQVRRSLALPFTYTILAMDWASWNGHINVLNWWHNTGLKLKYSENAMDWVSMNGHVDVLDWWRHSGLELRYSNRAIDWASENGHVDVLEWWRNSGFKLKYSEIAMDWASKNGHVDVLKWWQQFGPELEARRRP
ncbi:hypothetical protein BC828DRAFT_407649 [Blastocladiella britannica]|nr:hypothetical protein BC828DRAFT_407649 [Blastocladiella britannica]